MSATKGNGLDAANDQPAKTLIKRTTDFIALCGATVMNDARLFVLIWAAGQVLMLALMGVFQ